MNQNCTIKNPLDTQELDYTPESKIEILKKFTISFNSAKMVRKFSEKEIYHRIKYSACKNLIRMLNDYFPKLPGLSNIKKLRNISSNFIRNTNQKLNNIIFNSKLEEFLLQDFGDKNRSSYQNNLNNINFIKSQHPREVLLEKKLKEVFEIYFDSHYFTEELERIKKKRASVLL